MVKQKRPAQKKRGKSSGGTSEHCIDCLWLRTQINMDSGACYCCAKRDIAPGAPILWKGPCSGFLPADRDPASPIPAPRRR